MLTHYDIPEADPTSWTIAAGLVDRELLLSLDDLAAMEQHTVRVTMEFFAGMATLLLFVLASACSGARPSEPRPGVRTGGRSVS